MTYEQSSLFQVTVLNPAYDPGFTPVCGSLQATYNGFQIAIVVDYKKVIASFQSREGGFRLFFSFHGAVTWRTIVSAAIQQALCTAIQTAQNQIVSYLNEGRKLC